MAIYLLFYNSFLLGLGNFNLTNYFDKDHMISLFDICLVHCWDEATLRHKLVLKMLMMTQLNRSPKNPGDFLILRIRVQTKKYHSGLRDPGINPGMVLFGERGGETGIFACWRFSILQ